MYNYINYADCEVQRFLVINIFFSQHEITNSMVNRYMYGQDEKGNANPPLFSKIKWQWKEYLMFASSLWASLHIQDLKYK